MVAKAAQFRRAAPGPYEHGVVTLYQSQLADYRDAVNWLAEQSPPDAAVRLVEDLFPPLSLRGDNAAPSLWMQELAEVRFETTRASAARRWIAATWCIFHGGDFRRGYELAREAAELDPTSAMAQILYAIAGGFVGKRSDRGLAAAEAALPLARDPAESAFCFLILGNLMLNAGRADEARDVADSFAAWAEEQQYPSAIAYAYQLKAKLICEDEPSDAAELLTRGLDIVRTRTPGAFAAEHNLGRELILVTHRTDRTAAAQVALETLDLSLRHNETGNAVVTFGDTAIVLADAHHDHIAARALGAFRGGAMAPYHAAMLEHTKSTLRERLGAETYERLADQGAQMPPIELTRTVVIALRSLLDA